MGRQYVLDTIDATPCVGADTLSIYDDLASDFQIGRGTNSLPLTIADRRTHETIVGYPKSTPYSLLSGEGKHLSYAKRNMRDTLWVVDPLDGTKEFIEWNGEFTANIVLVYNSVPVVGVIYLSVKGGPYLVERILGAYKLSGLTTHGKASLEGLMAEAVRLPVKDKHSGSVTVASRSHLSPEIESYTEKMKCCHSDVELVSSGGSTKICLVVEERADVYLRFVPIMERGTAAGRAIAHTTGMEIYQAEKEGPLQYNKEDLLNPWSIVEPRHN